ncbi:MAG: PDZ domain-containing protein [Myxococcaceae bacterium]|nr:PDZ domain-containing protein [Myxococcaceae bacterium]
MKWRFTGQFWMVRLLFWVACIFLVASTINLWVGYRVEKSFLDKPVDLKPASKPAAQAIAQRDYARVNDRNLFGARREKINLIELDDTEKESGRWEDAVPSTLGARLVATAVFPGPQYSLASIESNGTIKSYSINECVPTSYPIDAIYIEVLGSSVTETLAPCNRLMNVATVKRIEEQRVIIYNERDRRYEYLGLNDASAPEPMNRRGLASSESSAQDLGSTIRRVGPNAYEIDGRDFDATMGNLARISNQARLIPAYENGKPIGFKVTNIVPNSVFAKVGLQSGDIIMRLNGYEINSPDKAFELFQTRSTAKNLSIDFKRDSSSYSSEISILR